MPQLYQGQYVDEQTDLAYNRFRYYDKESGNYISLNPIGLDGGMTLYSFVKDTNMWLDQFGLTGGIVYLRTDPFTGEEYVGQAKREKQFKDRTRKHNRKLQKKTRNSNAKYNFDRLEDGVKTQVQLNKLEEDWIRVGDGPAKKGGSLANERYQMNEKDYKAAGGKLERYH